MQIEVKYDRVAHLVHSCISRASHFTGKERDTESGNDYFGARYYASSMGRFMSPEALVQIAKTGSLAAK
jgi:RHS repeat-associated protein